MKRYLFWLLMIILTLGISLTAWGAYGEAGTTDSGNLPEGLGGYDFSDLDRILERDLKESGEGVTFSGILEKLISGNFSGAAGLAAEGIKDSLLNGIRENGRILWQVVALGITGALFSGFSGVFSSGQIGETGFFVTYLLVITLLAAGFSEGISLAEETLRSILEFMRALMPAYFLAAAFSGGSVTAAGLYEGMLLLLTAIQFLFLNLFLPGIRIYFMLMLAGHVVKEDMFSRLKGLMKTAVSWGIRTMLGMVIGINLVQGMVLPYADAVKNSSVTKLMEAIPGIGKGVGAAAKMVMGSGVLIKNTMGAGAVLVLLLLTIVPLLKLALMAFFYQLATVLLEPVCDKRIIACAGEAAEGYQMLLKMVGASLGLFVLGIAMVCAATNISYYAG